MADEIVVNSQFTASIFKASFPLISKYPEALYPGIHLTAYDEPVDMSDPLVKMLVT